MITFAHMPCRVNHYTGNRIQIKKDNKKLYYHKGINHLKSESEHFKEFKYEQDDNKQ